MRKSAAFSPSQKLRAMPLLSGVSNAVPRFQAYLQPKQVTVSATFGISPRKIDVMSVSHPEESERSSRGRTSGAL
jgi:hypothetical protein